MPNITRRNAVLTVLVASVVGLAACGSSANDEIVARVAGVGTVSKSTLEHWMPVEAVVLYEEQPSKSVPRGVIPDPPKYSSCISYLTTTPPKPGEGTSKPTSLQALQKCVHKYQELKVLTLNTLIGWYWTIGAGSALGLQVNPAEIRRRLNEVNARLFSSPRGFKNYLHYTGQTLADMLFRSKVQLFETKIVQKLTELERRLPPSLTQEQRIAALAKYTKTLPPGTYWADKTSCRVGYIVSACMEYKGPEPPGIPN